MVGHDDELTQTVEDVPILPSDVPVTMPDLPLQALITTERQFKAISDPVRGRVLDIIRHQPATAKQLADRLGVSPGAMGHHMKALEEAGLAQVVARRLVRGIVARYYTRTARIFMYQLPGELAGNASVEIVTHARDEFAATIESAGASYDDSGQVGFPHARISRQRAAEYEQRVRELIDEFLNEAPDPDGTVYGLVVAFFPSPPYVQEGFRTDEEDK